MKRFLSLFPLLIFIVIACQKKDFITDSSAKLRFSVDTVQFDTVFTTIGSATHNFTIHNDHSSSIKISSIKLAGGEKSPFKINIDGLPLTSDANLEIGPKDSIYIFVQVTVDPTNVNSPLLVSDSILFETNGNLQKVILEAMGQDVHLFKHADRFSRLKTQTWTNDRPYLIYDTLLLDSSQTLTIEEGTKIFFHRHASLIVDGTLIINGTLNNPVVLRGDRLDKLLSDLPYDKVPGQWDYLWLRNSSKGNKFNYTEIRNAVTGILIGGLGIEGIPDLELSNCKIENTSYSGILAIQSKIKGYNCLVDNCGTYCFEGIVGGNYEFYQSTFANYYSPARDPNSASVVLMNFFKIGVRDSIIPTKIDTIVYKGDLQKANFGNCIIAGSFGEELYILDDKNDKQLNYYFESCLIKHDIDHPDNNPIVTPADQTKFKKNVFMSYKDSTIFKSTEPYKCDFTLRKGSLAIDRGSEDIARQYPLDFFQVSRLADDGPDVGAFEFVK